MVAKITHKSHLPTQTMSSAEWSDRNIQLGGAYNSLVHSLRQTALDTDYPDHDPNKPLGEYPKGPTAGAMGVHRDLRRGYQKVFNPDAFRAAKLGDGAFVNNTICTACQRYMEMAGENRRVLSDFETVVNGYGDFDQTAPDAYRRGTKHMGMQNTDITHRGTISDAMALMRNDIAVDVGYFVSQFGTSLDTESLEALTKVMKVSDFGPDGDGEMFRARLGFDPEIELSKQRDHEVGGITQDAPERQETVIPPRAEPGPDEHQTIPAPVPPQVVDAPRRRPVVVPREVSGPVARASREPVAPEPRDTPAPRDTTVEAPASKPAIGARKALMDSLPAPKMSLVSEVETSIQQRATQATRATPVIGRRPVSELVAGHEPSHGETPDGSFEL